MAKGSERWGNKQLWNRMPLPGERAAAPRFDGLYRDDAQRAIRFLRDGTATIDDDPATWSMTSGGLALSSIDWDCEGSLGPSADTLFLLASPKGDNTRRTDWELKFVPGS